jgi:hypothetical protein
VASRARGTVGQRQIEQELAPIAPSVGILNEGHLHATLRSRYMEPGDDIEALVDGYIVDILRDDLIIEVQTANFSAIARKMRDLASRHRVRLVHPIARDRWIVKMPRQPGDASTRRRSPKHQASIDVFCELVSFPELIGHENFELDVVLVEEETMRRFDGRRGWRRRGWVTVERRLLAIKETIALRQRSDYASMIPLALAEEFDTSELAAAIGRPRWVAQRVAYCLRKAGLIEQRGTRGNAIVYAKAPRGDPQAADRGRVPARRRPAPTQSVTNGAGRETHAIPRGV